MSSEEMRTELEIFVNQGLQEGWRGWPRHDDRGFRRTDRTEPDLRDGPGSGFLRELL